MKPLKKVVVSSSCPVCGRAVEENLEVFIVLLLKGLFSDLVVQLAPPPKTSDDGRDQWPSRASFVLASMGGYCTV